MAEIVNTQTGYKERAEEDLKTMKEFEASDRETWDNIDNYVDELESSFNSDSLGLVSGFHRSRDLGVIWV